jgi:hypothetical protein
MHNPMAVLGSWDNHLYLYSISRSVQTNLLIIDIYSICWIYNPSFLIPHETSATEIILLHGLRSEELDTFHTITSLAL